MIAIVLTLLHPSFAGDCAVLCNDLGDCFKQCAGESEPRSCVHPVFDSAGNPTDCTVPVIDSTKGPSVGVMEGEYCVPNGPRTQVIAAGAARCPANDVGSQLGLYWSEPTRCDVWSNGRVVTSYAGSPRLTFIDCYSP